MLKALSIILVSSTLVTACVTQPYNDSSLAGDLDGMQKQMVELQNSLSDQFTASCSDSIVELDTKVEELKQAKETTRVIERCTSPTEDAPPATLDGKLLLGEIEIVKLPKELVSLPARIDSGAVTSSIGVFNLQNFERDGDKWVRFSMAEDDDAEVFEYPVYDIVYIKQTKELTEERIEIKIDIEMGDRVYKNQLFNLSDRSHLDYQLLIGRSFLKDIAVIDVGNKYLLEGE
ncbi:MAG: RimK/LysX family protein [Acidiferrobacterales bacterium]|nr:RimK/LysX family protein [Acidiferrobacterales bacterium]